MHQWSVLQVQIKQQLSERLNMIRNVRDELQPCEPPFDRSIGSERVAKELLSLLGTYQGVRLAVLVKVARTAGGRNEV